MFVQTRRVVFGGFFGLIALALIAGGLAGVPVAQAQDGGGYTVTVVGGVEQVQTFPDQEVNGYTFSDISFVSHYPEGGDLTVTITPPDGVTVDTVMTNALLSTTGVNNSWRAARGESGDEWVTTIFLHMGISGWAEFDAFWEVVGTDGSRAETEPVHGVYNDPTREWMRAESDDLVVYWYGMPEELGGIVLDEVAARRADFEAVFGPLDFRPLAVIFPPGPDWFEAYSSVEVEDDGEAGVTPWPDYGAFIQRVGPQARLEADRACNWMGADLTVEDQMTQTARLSAYGIAFLYLNHHEGVVQMSRPWYQNGLVNALASTTPYDVDERLRALVRLREEAMPTVQKDMALGSLHAAEDGCRYMGLDMWTSFVNWMTETQGGLAMHAAIVDELALAIPLGEAIENATGVPLGELENAWRASLGLPPVAAEALDAALALGPPVEPFFAEGEEVALPAQPFQQVMKTEPLESATDAGLCMANLPVTVLRVGNDGELNWYQVDCMGGVGWLHQGQLVGP